MDSGSPTTPVQSPNIDPRPLLAVWKILRDSPNQSERAWYLVANFLMTNIAGEFAAGRHTGRRDKQRVSLMPSHATLSSFHRYLARKASSYLVPRTMLQSINWAIGMYMMIVCSRAYHTTGTVSQLQRPSDAEFFHVLLCL